jgi:Calponin homology (CH) domain
MSGEDDLEFDRARLQFYESMFGHKVDEQQADEKEARAAKEAAAKLEQQEQKERDDENQQQEREARTADVQPLKLEKEESISILLSGLDETLDSSRERSATSARRSARESSTRVAGNISARDEQPKISDIESRIAENRNRLRTRGKPKRSRSAYNRPGSMMVVGRRQQDAIMALQMQAASASSANMPGIGDVLAVHQQHAGATQFRQATARTDSDCAELSVWLDRERVVVVRVSPRHTALQVRALVCAQDEALAEADDALAMMHLYVSGAAGDDWLRTAGDSERYNDSFRALLDAECVLNVHDALIRKLKTPCWIVRPGAPACNLVFRAATLCAFVNAALERHFERDFAVRSLERDLSDGVVLMHLADALLGAGKRRAPLVKRVSARRKAPKIKAKSKKNRCANVQRALAAFGDAGICFGGDIDPLRIVVGERQLAAFIVYQVAWQLAAVRIGALSRHPLNRSVLDAHATLCSNIEQQQQQQQKQQHRQKSKSKKPKKRSSKSPSSSSSSAASSSSSPLTSSERGCPSHLYFKAKLLARLKQSIAPKGVFASLPTKLQDLHASWRSGMALCALVSGIDESAINCDKISMKRAENLALAVRKANQHLHVSPVIDVSQFNERNFVVDEYAMIVYLTQFFSI